MEGKDLDNALQIAETAVKKAGEYLLLRENSTKQLFEKSSRDHLLVADVESESIIIDILEKNFPEHGILSEERGLLREKSQYRWIIDPLDGSFNYEHGDKIFGIVLGLMLSDNPLLSVMYMPEINVMITVQKGGGVKKNGQIIRVSNTQYLNTARLQFGDFAKDDKGTANGERIEDLRRLAGKIGRVRMVGSSAADFIAVATGISDAFIVRNPDPWDFLVGQLVVEEAGGKITKHKFEHSELYIASNGIIHTLLEDLLVGL